MTTVKAIRVGVGIFKRTCQILVYGFCKELDDSEVTESVDDDYNKQNFDQNLI